MAGKQIPDLLEGDPTFLRPDERVFGPVRAVKRAATEENFEQIFQQNPTMPNQRCSSLPEDGTGY